MAVLHCTNCGRAATVVPSQTTVHRNVEGQWFQSWPCPGCGFESHISTTDEHVTELLADGARLDRSTILPDEADYWAEVLEQGHDDQVWDALGGRPHD